MTNRDRVIAAIKHQLPDRIPSYAINIDNPQPYLDYLKLNTKEELQEHLDFDLRSINPLNKLDLGNCNHFGTSGGSSDYSKSTSYRPFAEIDDVKKIAAYKWPDTNNWDYSKINNDITTYNDKFALVAGGWNPIFCQVLDFFGMEEAMVNMCLKPILIEATVYHIEHYYLEYYKKFFDMLRGRCQIFNMGDDFATQRGMMISPEHWRKYLKPTYKKIFYLAKQHGMYVWFHSCGAIREVLPDLVEIGMDVWETVQTHLPGNEPNILKRNFGQDITFFGGINTQQTLPYGKPEDVRAEVREKIKILGKNGGYICGPDHHIKVDVPIENTLALYDEIRKFHGENYTC